MSVSRRISVVAVILTMSVVVLGGTIAAAIIFSNKSSTDTSEKTKRPGPQAVVDKESYDLGPIESGLEFGHTYVIRNEGDQPLTLAEGKGLCRCLKLDIHAEPVQPGQEALIKVVAADSVKNEPMNPGPFSRSMLITTNDPDRPDITLKLFATVTPRLCVSQSPVAMTVDSSKEISKKNGTADVLIYSERWDKFELSSEKSSRKGIQWRVEPATQELLTQFEAKCGYRVYVTLPPDMSEGRFAEWIDFIGKPAGRKSARDDGLCRLELRGRLEGRLTFYSPKITDGDVLQLGSRDQGESVRESFLLKVKDSQRDISVQDIEAKPEFLKVKMQPQSVGAKSIGLYRIEVEIPCDAPVCEHTGADRGIVRVKTNHPRFSTIEFRVDFVVTAKNRQSTPLASR